MKLIDILKGYVYKRRNYFPLKIWVKKQNDKKEKQ